MRVEKRQKWLQSISGQGTGQAIGMQGDAATVGAMPGGLGASAGRPMRGMLGGQAAQPTSTIGLSGMCAPTSRAGALGQSAPMGNLVRPVKAISEATYQSGESITYSSSI